MDVLLGYTLWSLWASPDKHLKVTDFYIGNEYHQSGLQRAAVFFFFPKKEGSCS